MSLPGGNKEGLIPEDQRMLYSNRMPTGRALTGGEKYFLNAFYQQKIKMKISAVKWSQIIEQIEDKRY